MDLALHEHFSLDRLSSGANNRHVNVLAFRKRFKAGNSDEPGS
jgi:hypothetical protein